MAHTTTIDSSEIVLIDRWGPAPQALMNPPHNAFDDAHHFNVVAPIWEKGTLVVAKNDDSVGGLVGWSAFRYLKIGTQNAAVAIAVKHLLVPSLATDLFTVSNDPDANLITGGDDARAVAIALAAMTNGRHGFAWSGGVCPEGLLTDLDGNFLTDGTVAAGAPMATVNGADPDLILFKLAATAGYSDIGYSLAIDG